MRTRSWLVTSVATIALTAIAVAQVPPTAAPEAGSVPGVFRSFIVADERFEKGSPRNRDNKMHCLVCDNSLNPVVAVFARTVPEKTDSGLAKLLTQLDQLVIDYRGERFGAFAIFLTLGKEYPEEDARDAKVKPVRDLFEGLKKNSTLARAGNVPFGLAAGKSEMTDAWKLQETEDVTVVLYHRMKILNQWTFTADKPISDDEIKTITAAAVKEILTLR